MQEENFYEYDNSLRDSIATVDKDGKRIWVYPKKPKGSFHNRRIIVTLLLLSAFFAGPFIKINGHPLLLLNIFERKFIVFGLPFWPQDFILFALSMITMVVFIILFTVVFGRLWCGWACPQTLFMEMVFRKIEYWIEGDANKQRKLNKMPWNAEKISKKGLKHVVFILVAFLISHTVMAYLIGIDAAKELITHSPLNNLSGFIGLVAFTGIFYSVFAFLREQACTVICPYGRLQSVLLTKDSIVVAYDWLRGEPRGRIKKNKEQEQKGDCIDCKLCVHACPTGIDIRGGTQLECVNCTACIDACDEVMLKINKPKGLIRYDSYNGIKESKTLSLNPRIAGYIAVLALLLGATSYLMANRSSIETTILKVPGTLYQKQANGDITNLYKIQFINKTFDSTTIKAELINFEGASLQQVGKKTIQMQPNSMLESVYIIEIPRDKLTSSKTSLKIGIYNNDKLIDVKETSFLSPRKRRKK